MHLESNELPLIAALGGREGGRSLRQMSADYAWNKGAPPPHRLEHPVTLVSYVDAGAFCAWLAQATAQLVRLSTEAEWEGVARGAATRAPSTRRGQVDTSRANYLDDETLKRANGTRQVGSYVPDELGLFDLAGNVWEWVADWYGGWSYADSPARNPEGPADGRFRVLRGGGGPVADVVLLRCSYRHHVPVDTYS